MKPAELTAEEQTAILAERYSQRAEAYDKFWSPVIRPAGECLVRQLPLGAARSVIDVGTGAGALLPAIARAAPSATILGVDRSEGMLRLARKKYPGWLALMDVQNLALSAYRFDAAVVAFILFHLPTPERCLSEVNRVLKPAGVVGTITWAAERTPTAGLLRACRLLQPCLYLVSLWGVCLWHHLQYLLSSIRSGSFFLFLSVV